MPGSFLRKLSLPKRCSSGKLQAAMPSPAASPSASSAAPTDRPAIPLLQPEELRLNLSAAADWLMPAGDGLHLPALEKRDPYNDAHWPQPPAAIATAAHPLGLAPVPGAFPWWKWLTAEFRPRQYDWEARALLPNERLRLALQLHASGTRTLELSSRDDLRGVYLGEARLQGAVLWGAWLECADFRDAHLQGARLYAAHLEAADLTRAHLQGVNLGEAHLEAAYLFRANLEGAVLGNAHLSAADLGECNLKGADLAGAHLEAAELKNAHLEGAHLHGATLIAANLTRTWLHGADFSQANLAGAILRQVRADSAQVTMSEWAAKADTPEQLQAREALVARSRAGESAQSSSVLLEAASFAGADLGAADLLEANLSGCDMTSIRVKWRQPALTYREHNRTLPVIDQLQHLSTELSPSETAGKRFRNSVRQLQALQRGERIEDLGGREEKTVPLGQTRLTRTRLVDTQMKDVSFGLGLPFLGRGLGHPLRHFIFRQRLGLAKGDFVHWDDSLIERCRLPRNLHEPWTELKRHYTGFMFGIVMALAILAFLPYLIEAFSWRAIASFNEMTEAPAADIRSAAQVEGDHRRSEAEEEEDRPHPQRQRILWKTIGFGQDPFIIIALNLALLAYAASRYTITMKISHLFRDEQSSGYTPRWGEVRPWFYFHWYYMRPMAIIGFIYPVIRVAMVLLTYVEPPDTTLPPGVEQYLDERLQIPAAPGAGAGAGIESGAGDLPLPDVPELPQEIPR